MNLKRSLLFLGLGLALAAGLVAVGWSWRGARDDKRQAVRDSVLQAQLAQVASAMDSVERRFQAVQASTSQALGVIHQQLGQQSAVTQHLADSAAGLEQQLAHATTLRDTAQAALALAETRKAEVVSLTKEKALLVADTTERSRQLGAWAERWTAHRAVDSTTEAVWQAGVARLRDRIGELEDRGKFLGLVRIPLTLVVGYGFHGSNARRECEQASGANCQELPGYQVRRGVQATLGLRLRF